MKGITGAVLQVSHSANVNMKVFRDPPFSFSPSHPRWWRWASDLWSPWQPWLSIVTAHAVTVAALLPESQDLHPRSSLFPSVPSNSMGIRLLPPPRLQLYVGLVPERLSLVLFRSYLGSLRSNRDSPCLAISYKPSGSLFLMLREGLQSPTVSCRGFESILGDSSTWKGTHFGHKNERLLTDFLYFISVAFPSLRT